ncbi:MAG: hypothetical protein R3D29_01045 [Nitratireductor sp.]
MRKDIAIDIILLALRHAKRDAVRVITSRFTFRGVPTIKSLPHGRQARIGHTNAVNDTGISAPCGMNRSPLVHRADLHLARSL